jgi:hypothetical protein
MARAKRRRGADIQKWNAAQPPAARLTMSPLQHAQKRADTTDPTKKYMGVSLTKNTQWIAARDRALY